MESSTQLRKILEAAASGNPEAGLIFYQPSTNTTVRTSYASLYQDAITASRIIPTLSGIRPDSIILLHFSDHQQNVKWFWATVLAGYVPAMSPPLVNDPKQHFHHLAHLQRLLMKPLILTDESFVGRFAVGPTGITVHAVNDLVIPPVACDEMSLRSLINGDDHHAMPLHSVTNGDNHHAMPFRSVTNGDNHHAMPLHSLTNGDNHHAMPFSSVTNGDNHHAMPLRSVTNGDNHHAMPLHSLINGDNHHAQSLEDRPCGRNAALMLTSGSTGNAKAVMLRDVQIVEAVRGKSQMHGTTSKDVFLNWIGLDHVAGLTESHLHAMWLGADQVHVQAEEFIGNPISFISTLDRFRVAHTFAPNFFLASLDKALGQRGEGSPVETWDLGNLHTITSGGEANLVGTAVSLLEKLKPYGLKENVISPGFGMTETCAGCIYNKQFPSYEISKGLEFASVGSCMDGISMRITQPGGQKASPGEVGSLEISGPVVFLEYFNDPLANQKSFTSDGWYVPGDLAYIDASGYLRLAGREKDIVNINGIKYGCDELEMALENARVAGVEPSRLKVAAYRPKDAATESPLVFYCPSHAIHDDKARYYVSSQMKKIMASLCAATPYRVIPVPAAAMPKTTLGKISRAKLVASFADGRYDAFDEENRLAIKRYTSASLGVPSTEMEHIVCEVIAHKMGLPKEEMGTTSAITDMGVSSVEVISIKQELQRRLGIKEIPFVTFLANTTVADLASALVDLSKPRQYNPLVVLNATGSNLPFWWVHPGAGEVLVYLNLAKYFADRPVYALRARGFDGEPYFESIPELVETYVASIRKQQPHGPYAIMGYSFGSMFAYEISKRLIQDGDEVKFLGILNLPPHVKYRIRQLNLNTAVLTLALFLDMIVDDDPDAFHPDFWTMTHHAVFDEVLKRAPPGRLEEVGLTYQTFMTWAEVSNSLHVMAWDYDPSGRVPVADVFIAHPLKAVARNKDEWFELQVSKWRDFVDSVRFHNAEGEHFNMIDEHHVQTFHKTLRTAMQARGV